jgi:hypothetical protein
MLVTEMQVEAEAVLAVVVPVHQVAPALVE